MNSKGTRFLAILAVLAMAFAGFAVLAVSSDSDATPAADETLPISVSKATDETVTNESMGNIIDLYYQKTTNTFYLTGVLSKVNVEATGDTAQKAMYDEWNSKFSGNAHKDRLWMFAVDVYTEEAEGNIWYEDIYDVKVSDDTVVGGVAYKVHAANADGNKTLALIFAVKQADAKGEITIFADKKGTTEVGGTEYTISYDFTLSDKCLADGVGTTDKGVVNENGGILDFAGLYNSTNVDTTKAGTYKNAAGETVNYDGTTSQAATNVDLGNNVKVSYDPLTKTYKLVGTLAYLDPVFTKATSEYSNVNNPSKLAFAVDNTWVPSSDEKKYTLGTIHYGLVASAVDAGIKGNIYNGDTAIGTAGLMLSMSSSDLKTYTITFGTADNKDAVKYYVDVSELQLSDAIANNPAHPYTMIDDTKVTLEEAELSGYDIAGGSWSYAWDGTAKVGTLKLVNYNGSEKFTSEKDLIITLEGVNSIELSKSAYAIKTTGDLEIKSKSMGGDGTLAIEMDNDTSIEKIAEYVSAICAISGKNIQINYVGLEVTVSKVLDDTVLTAVGGVDASEALSIYHSTIAIDIEDQAGVHSTTEDTFNVGIEGNGVSITGQSDLTISAGVPVCSEGALNVATSSIDATGYTVGILAIGKAVFADNSFVEAKVSGDYLTNELPFGIFFNDTADIESGSVIVADSMTNLKEVNVNASLTVGNALIAANFTNGALGKTVFNGNVVIVGAAVLTNASDDAKGSSMINNGSITTSKTNGKNFDDALVFGQAVTTTAGTAWTASKYYAEVDVKSTMLMVNGDAIIGADVTVYSLAYDGTKFTHTVIGTQEDVYAVGKIDKDGKLQSATFSVDSENHKYGSAYATETLNVTITKKTEGTSTYYEVATDGKYFDSTGTARSFEDAKATAVKYTAHTTSDEAISSAVLIMAEGGSSKVTVTSGTFTSTGSVYLVNACDELINGSTAKFNGNVTSEAALTLVKGTMTGSIVINAGGSLTIATDASATGNVTTKGAVSVAGKLTGDVDILADKDLTVGGTLKGNITTEKVTTLSLTGFEGKITYSGKYWSSAAAQAAAKAGDEPDMEFKNVIDAKIVGKGQTVIKTVASAVATPGVFQFDGAGAVKADKTSLVEINEGELKFMSSIEVVPDFVVRANASEAGTTVSVMGKSTKISVSGSFEVQDGVTLNVYEVDKKYGTIDTEINYSYTGYTYFCGLNYALKNAPAGIVINVQKNATGLTGEISVKDGVVIETNTYSIAFDDKTLLTMGEGAYFNLGTGSTVKFAASADDTDDKKYNVSGVFVAGENMVVIEQAKLKEATEIKSAEKLSVTMAYDRGTVTAATGEITGALKMSDYDSDSALDNAVYVAGKFVISSLAVYDGSVTTDEHFKARVVIDGTFKITSNKAFMKYDTTSVNEVEVPVTGIGAFVLGDGQSIKFSVYDDTLVEHTNVKKLNQQNIEVIYGDNAVDFDGVKVKETAVTVTGVKATSTKAAYMGFNGSYDEGTVTTEGNVQIDGASKLLTKDDAYSVMIVPADTVLTIQSGKAMTAQGLLKVAGTVYYKTETVTDYGTLDYQVTYPEGSYEVYTYLSAASANAPAGTVITVDDNLSLTGNTKISEDVSIVVAEGKYIELEYGSYLVIGKGQSVLGAASVFSGNIALNGAGSFVLDFVGTGSDITVWTNKSMTELAYDQAIITQDVKYATVYTVDENEVFNANMKTVAKPTVTGYFFGSWQLQNGASVTGTTKMSDGPFVANLIASKVSITFAPVEGVQYYYNNVAVSAPGVTLQLDYDTQITAKAKSGYQGTALVNGKAVYYAQESGTVTATGVTPVPEPTPEPVDENTGLSLTDILLIVLVVLIAIMVVVLVLRLNRS